MQHLNVNKNREQGFTLMEQMIVLVIVGILAAISAPSMVGMYNNQKLNAAVSQVRGALLEAQRNAMKKSANCTVTLDTSNNKITGTSGCLLETRDLSPTKFDTATSSTTIAYNYRGELTTSELTVVLASDYVSAKKCLVLSEPLGIIRTGVYDNNSNPKCNK